MNSCPADHRSFAERAGHAALVAVFLSLIISACLSYRDIYFANNGLLMANGEVLGGDFSCFYVAGKTADKDISKLYDWEYGLKMRRELLGDPEGKFGVLVYAYPPFLLSIFQPLSRLPFSTACYAWLTLSAILGLGAVLLVCRECRASKRETLLCLLAALAFLPFSIDSLAGGQLTSIGMLVCAVAFRLLNKKRSFLAGMVLALGLYKFPVFALLWGFFLFRREYKVISGVAAGCVLLFILSWAFWGIDPLLSWPEGLKAYSKGLPFLEALSLRSDKSVSVPLALKSLVGNHLMPVMLLYFLTVFLFFLTCRRATYNAVLSGSAFSMQFAFMISVSLLLSPQIQKYDTSLLLVPAAIVFLNRSVLDRATQALFFLSLTALYLHGVYPYIQAGSVSIPSAAPALILWMVSMTSLLPTSRQLSVVPRKN